MNVRRHQLSVCLLFILPLIVGAILYYLLCPEVYFVKALDYILPVSLHIPYDMMNGWGRLFRNYIFDLLWALSLMAAVFLAAGDDMGFRKKSIGIASALEILLEVIQVIPEIAGTFDICDILIEIAADVFVILLLKERVKYEEKE